MTNSEVSILNNIAGSTFHTSLVVTSLFGLSAEAQMPTEPETMSPVEYVKALDAPGSHSVTELNIPSDSEIISGLLEVHEQLLSNQEVLDEELQALLYENIDDLYA